MANINLSTEEAQEKVDLNVGGSGLAILIIALLLILAAYGAELLYGQKLARDTEAIREEMDAKYKNISKGNPITVVDFQNRLNSAKTAVNEGRDIRENLLEIEKSIIPGVYLESYDFEKEGGVLVLDCIGDNYNLVAKQILNFKKSTYFAGASGGETSFEAESGKVGFKVNLTLK
jgi:hypothetical protein